MLNIDSFSYENISRKTQKEIASLIERRNNLLKALENEIDNLNDQKASIIADAGAKAYSNYLTNNDYGKGLIAFWKEIDIIESQKIKDYDKMEELIKRYDEDINILYNNELQTSGVDHQAISSQKNNVCSICGTVYEVGKSNFCSNCGNKLKNNTKSTVVDEEKADEKTFVKKNVVCPKCHNVVDPQTVFCIHCGTKIN